MDPVPLWDGWRASFEARGQYDESKSRGEACVSTVIEGLQDVRPLGVDPHNEEKEWEQPGELSSALESLLGYPGTKRERAEGGDDPK